MRIVEVLGAVVALLVLWRLAAHLLRRTARKTVLRIRPRLDRYKLTRKRDIIATLLQEPSLATAVEMHARAHGLPESQVWDKVRAYLDEIIPFFNILAYYRLGMSTSRVVLNLLYKVSIESSRPDPFRGLPRDAVVIYLMNHRSNADYVLVAYALAGDVSISYAVGEWARAFPLEYIFKSFGSYFIRRRYREPLYHVVLEQYVQLITKHGVTQGIFPEGGLTRDGKLQQPKVGLLDYMLGAGRDRSLRSRMYVVPIAVNYDRVLEDRSLLGELARRDGQGPSSRWSQFFEVAHYLSSNVTRLLLRRWQRYGRAVVCIGEPIPVAPWMDALQARGVDFFAIPRAERLGHVQALCDVAMERIGSLIPVTAVPLTCAALQSFDGEFVPRAALFERMRDMRDVLLELNARVIRADRDVEETFERAHRMLRMRRVIAETENGYLILPRGRELISYYANSIVHLLGSFTAGVKARDSLPVGRALDPG